MNDTDHAKALAANLRAHYGQLVEFYQDRLFAFALRLTGSAQDAEEIVQDAFVRGYFALERYPQERIEQLRVLPWLYQITINVARNKRRRRRLSVVSLDADSLPVSSTVSDREQDRPEPSAERAETRQELAQSVAALPERFRIPIVLRHVQGISYSEIALILKQPVGTVKSNVHRGTAMLRQALSASRLGSTIEGGTRYAS